MANLRQQNRKQLTSQLASLMAMRKRKQVDSGFNRGQAGLGVPKLQQPGMRLKKLPRRY